MVAASPRRRDNGGGEGWMHLRHILEVLLTGFLSMVCVKKMAERERTPQFLA